MITMSAVNHSFMSFNQNGVLNDEDDELLDVFPRMWIDIWHPFQRGDILKFRTNKCDAPEYLVFDGTSDDFDADDGSEALNAIIINKPSGTHMMSREAPGDSTAMVGYGYFLLPGGQTIYSSVPNYLNLERCNEKLPGNLRILTAISSYLEGKISVDILLNAYYIIRQEGQAMVERSLMNERQMMLTLAGLGNNS